MKKRLSIAILVLFASLQMACQFEHYYVVVNATNEPITVQYHFKVNPYREHFDKKGVPVQEHFYVEPKLKRLSGMEKDSKAWQITLERRLIRDEANGELRVTLQPGEALQVFSDSGMAQFVYDNHPEERKTFSDFPIADITISGNKGQVTIKDESLFKLFVEYKGPSDHSGFIYQLRYE